MKSRAMIGRALSIVAEKRFYYLIIGLLVAQAVWIALSSKYPMAFDEDFHLGIIRLYAHHISPFWGTQPAGADAFGAVARDPSYLYHWLMSFPYRIITLVTHSQAVIVICLRFINIALFTSGLFLFRRLLLRSGTGRVVVHLSMLIFVLLPVVPLLAAQINYDNLFLPVVAGTLLLGLRIRDRLIQRNIPVLELIWLMIICLLGSLIKYAFLPLFLAVGLYILVLAWRSFSGTRKFREVLRIGSSSLSLKDWLLCGAVLIVASGLFVQRYGVNLVVYHNPVPDCSQVLTVKQCGAYGPWDRDYNLALHKQSTNRNPLIYTEEWLKGMWSRSFFAVGGPATGFQTKGPMPVPAVTAVIVAAVSAVALLIVMRRLLRRYDRSVLFLFGLVTFIYICALWFEEYREFLQTGEAVAVNGRYLLPILLFVMIAGALALRELLRNHFRLQLGLSAAIIVCMTWGGGALTYILRSEQTWYWDSVVVHAINHSTKKVLGPVTPGYNNPNKYLP